MLRKQAYNSPALLNIKSSSHDISFVYGCDPPSLVAGGIVKGILGNALRLLSGDDLEALNNSWDTFMLQTTVLPLCVLTDYYNVYILMPRRRGGGEEERRGGEKEKGEERGGRIGRGRRKGVGGNLATSSTSNVQCCFQIYSYTMGRESVRSSTASLTPTSTLS